MAKTVSERVRDHRLRRRETARASDSCLVCFKEAAMTGCVVCTSCNQKAKVRVKRSRALKAARRALESAASPFSNEEASSRTIRHLLQTATRLMLAGDFAPAGAVLNGAYTQAQEMRNYELAAEVLEHSCRHAWSVADSAKWLGNSAAMARLPLQRSSIWRLEGFLRLARAYAVLGKPEKAFQALHAAATKCDFAKVGALSKYLETRAIAEQASCMKAASLRDFQVANELAESLNDVWAQTFVAGNFAAALARFGDYAGACKFHLREIELTSSNAMGWLAHSSKIAYGQSLLLFGKVQTAHDILSRVPAVSGDHVRLAVDRSILAGILHNLVGSPAPDTRIDEIVRAAFRSKMPDRIAGIAAVQHRLHIDSGDQTSARDILNRALANLRSAGPAMLIMPWLIVEVIRFGTIAQLEQTAAVLNGRSDDDILPAFKNLVKGTIALRRDDLESGLLMLGRAESVFRQVGFKYFEALAIELSGRHSEALDNYEEIGATRDAGRLKSLKGLYASSRPALTTRQRAVVRLVISGRGLRDIAKELHISEKTVEHHLSASMQSIGVRNRRELRESPRVAYLIDNARE